MMNRTQLLGLAALGIVGATGLYLYRRPAVRRAIKAQTFDAMAMTASPLARMTGKSRHILGRRFFFGKQMLERKAEELRQKAAAERVRAMAGL